MDTPCGVEFTQATIVTGTAMGLFYSLFNGLGRISWGTISDKLGRKNSIALMSLIQGVMMILFHFGNQNVGVGLYSGGHCLSGGGGSRTSAPWCDLRKGAGCSRIPSVPILLPYSRLLSMPASRASRYLDILALTGLFSFAAFTLAPDVGAQALEPRAPVERTEVGGRFHLQFNTSSADGVPSSAFLVRRARIWVATRVNEWIDGAVQVDVAGLRASARYAFVRFSLSPAARLSFGQFKRAFDNFELTSSSEILVIERDGFIRGAFDCAGLHDLCSYSAFSERLFFSSLDVGALLQGEVADGKFGYLMSVTNGTGPNAFEENGAKSFSGRVEWLPSSKLTVGANAGFHDYINGVTEQDAYASAAALDVEVGDFGGGFHLQAGLMAGQNWRNLRDDGTESSFVAWQGIATYRIPLLGDGKFRAVEPVGRVSWGDPDRGAGADGGMLITPGLVLHLDGKNKMSANVDIWHPQSGGTVWGFKAQTYLYF